MILQSLRERYTCPRDRIKLVLMSVIVGIVLLGLGLDRSYHYHLSGKHHHLEAQALLAWIDSNRSRFQATATAVESPTASLLERVGIKADQLGITQDRIQPQGDHGLQVWLNAVPFDAFITWLNGLADDGIHVVSIQIDSPVDGGKVNVHCQLSDRSE